MTEILSCMALPLRRRPWDKNSRARHLFDPGKHWEGDEANNRWISQFPAWPAQAQVTGRQWRVYVRGIPAKESGSRGICLPPAHLSLVEAASRCIHSLIVMFPVTGLAAQAPWCPCGGECQGDVNDWRGRNMHIVHKNARSSPRNPGNAGRPDGPQKA